MIMIGMVNVMTRLVITRLSCQIISLPFFGIIQIKTSQYIILQNLGLLFEQHTSEEGCGVVLSVL
jgi:hypothetical protein